MNRTIAIRGDGLALALALPDEGMPEILAFGPGAEAASWTAPRANRENGMDEDVPSARLLPTGGLGHFGWPAILGHRDGRASVIAFADWEVEDRGSRCVLTARDALVGLEIAIEAKIADMTLCLTTRLTNIGADIFTLDRCMAGNMIAPEGPIEIQSFGGGWGREFQTRSEPLTARLWMQESRRGRTSHDRSPSVILDRLAAHLGWSGNHVMAVETLDDGRRLVHLGELFEPGEMRLAPGEAYASPTAYFASHADALRRRIVAEMTWPEGGPTPRPVTLNTWEGVYFDHRLPQLMAQAAAAAELGVERVVLGLFVLEFLRRRIVGGGGFLRFGRQLGQTFAGGLEPGRYVGDHRLQTRGERIVLGAQPHQFGVGQIVRLERGVDVGQGDARRVQHLALRFLRADGGEA